MIVRPKVSMIARSEGRLLRLAAAALGAGVLMIGLWLLFRREIPYALSWPAILLAALGAAAACLAIMADLRKVAGGSRGSIFMVGLGAFLGAQHSFRKIDGKFVGATADSQLLAVVMAAALLAYWFLKAADRDRRT